MQLLLVLEKWTHKTNTYCTPIDSFHSASWLMIVYNVFFDEFFLLELIHHCCWDKNEREFLCCGISPLKNLINQDVALLLLYPFFLVDCCLEGRVYLCWEGPGVQWLEALACSSRCDTGTAIFKTQAAKWWIFDHEWWFLTLNSQRAEAVSSNT